MSTDTSSRVDSSAPPPVPPRIGRWMLLVGVVIMLAGLLFGYDQGVISGALDGIQQSFSVSTFMLEVITSWVTLGAMVGALAAGTLADRFGRKLTIIGSAALFTAGAILESVAPNSNVLVVGRLIVGAGVGVASVAAPLFAAEMAPSRLRGRFVSLYQLAITIGIFIAYFVDYLLTHVDRWRVMLGVSAIPAILLLLAILPLPDSPRWYMTKDRRADAERALAKVEPHVDVATELDSVARTVADEMVNKASWGEVFAPRWRKPLMIGVSLAFLQQVTGINAIIYYADKIFAAAGFDSPTSQSLATLWAIGAVNVVATLIAVVWVDRFGRKPLLLIGSTGMFLSLVVVGFMFLKLDNITTSTSASGTPSNAGLVTLVALVVFIASFAFSLGPVVWTVINEIYPSRIRGKGVAVATGVNWFAAWLVSQFFLTLVDLISETGVFWLFAAFCLVTYVFVKRVMPETKGRTLEEIETMWGDPSELSAAVANRFRF